MHQDKVLAAKERSCHHRTCFSLRTFRSQYKVSIPDYASIHHEHLLRMSIGEKGILTNGQSSLAIRLSCSESRCASACGEPHGNGETYRSILNMIPIRTMGGGGGSRLVMM